MSNKSITVRVIINAPIDQVWSKWNEPKHITSWAFASDDWEAPKAENDLRVGGKFITTMAAKDKSASFDFNGIYTQVIPNKLIEYTIKGGRKVSIKFEEAKGGVKVTETFEMEDINSEELQRGGWQSILNNFKKYAEGGK